MDKQFAPTPNAQRAANGLRTIAKDVLALIDQHELDLSELARYRNLLEARRRDIGDLNSEVSKLTQQVRDQQSIIDDLRRKNSKIEGERDALRMEKADRLTREGMAKKGADVKVEDAAPKSNTLDNFLDEVRRQIANGRRHEEQERAPKSSWPFPSGGIMGRHALFTPGEKPNEFSVPHMMPEIDKESVPVNGGRGVLPVSRGLAEALASMNGTQVDIPGIGPVTINVVDMTKQD